jgi:hypothetical protein
VLSLVLASLTGCLQTHNGEPKRPDVKPVFVSASRIPGLNAPLPDHWERVFIGALPRPHLEGYLKTSKMQEGDSTLLVRWVYDNEFRLVGMMTDTGRTTRFDRGGRAEYVGVLDLEESCLSLLGYDAVTEVRFEAMPEPAE